MPLYRINGVMVHIKLDRRTKAPAPCCARITLPSGVEDKCGAISNILCDYELESGGTCDAPLCAQHAHRIGPNRHLCPIHAGQQARRQPELF